MASVTVYPLPTQQAAVQPIPQESLRSSRWAFYALCVFVVVQAYMIPVLQLGPSWAIWPGLTDFAIGLLGITIFYKSPSISKDNRVIFGFLLFVAYFLFLSYFGQTIWFGLLGIREMNGSQGVNFGMFQVYRVFQATFIYWAIMRIPLTASRLRILRNLVLITFLLVCLGIMLTYFEVVKTESLAPHITDNINVGGPWSKFYKRNPEGDGLGTIGYNHSYPGSQVLMLMALYAHLERGKRSALTAILIGLGLFTVFITGARSGLAGTLVWVLAYFIRKPQLAILGFAAALIGLSVIMMVDPSTLLSERTLERQSALADPLSSESLSGRPTLWADHIGYLKQNWTRWLIGGGFGSNMETGHYSHQNYLQITMETGLLGLSIAAAFAFTVLSRLWKNEGHERSIFWVTLGLMVTALNDEALYPIPHRVHFLSLYCASLAIALRSKESETETVEEERTSFAFTGHNR
ncbi:MAG: O-antigen ligase family protein [Anaerolineae bacterium]|nr:O-antigen ligase family protein [Anaerolineae bacterium]